MKEWVVISGKGGTGKTSIVASFAVLAAGRSVVADCDVDAADLHLVLEPKVLRSEPYSGGSKARILADRCTACGECAAVCRFRAVMPNGAGGPGGEAVFRVDPIACEGCGVCVRFCPEEAIEFVPAISGEWFLSEARVGPMVHARLGVAAENSGKLVSLVRRQAKEIAEQRDLDYVLIDGAPGVGCPVIASITGADLVLVVTEPTWSGLHDLERVVDLTAHFRIATRVCINKWDLNPRLAGEIQDRAERRGARVVGRVRFDPAVTEAQIRRKTIVEYANGNASADIRALWAGVVRSASDPPRPA